MRISINDTFRSGDRVVLPTDPPQPENLDGLFSIDLFQASNTSPKPFEPIEISWLIAPTEENTSPDDFEFIVLEVAGFFLREILFESIELTGRGTWSAIRSLTLRIMGRRKSAGRWSFIGPAIDVTLDLTDCRVAVTSRLIFDIYFLDKFESEVTSSPQIRYRRSAPSFDPSMQTPPIAGEILPPKIKWSDGSIQYDFPLELVIKSFPNADFDLKLEIRLSAILENDIFTLDVDVSYEFDVNFDTAEYVLTGGTAALIRKTIKKMMPMVIDCRAKEIERTIAATLLDRINELPDGRRERIAAIEITGGDTEEIRMIFCPPPPLPPRPQPLVSP